MKIENVLLIVVFGMLFVTCKKEKSLKEYMTDSWETTYLKIEMPTVNNTDSLSVYVDEFDNNTEVIAQSKYNLDGTFSAWFVNQKGEKNSESKGVWSIKNDSLHIEYFYAGRDVKVNYKVIKTDVGFDAVSLYDWDEDDVFDDLLLMKTKRIKTE
jgi:hypothetical protein